MLEYLKSKFMKILHVIVNQILKSELMIVRIARSI